MLCTRCGKRPAVVFVSNNNSKDAPTAGYCLTCAKELGIKPVEDLISKMGISDEDLENVQDQMNTLMNSMGDGDMSQLMEQLGADNLAEQMGDFAKDGDGSEDDDFSHVHLHSLHFSTVCSADRTTMRQIRIIIIKRAKKRKKKRTESTSIFTVKTSHARRERAKSTALSAETARLSV